MLENKLLVEVPIPYILSRFVALYCSHLLVLRLWSLVLFCFLAIFYQTISVWVTLLNKQFNYKSIQTWANGYSLKVLVFDVLPFELFSLGILRKKWKRVIIVMKFLRNSSFLDLNGAISKQLVSDPYSSPFLSLCVHFHSLVLCPCPSM